MWTLRPERPGSRTNRNLQIGNGNRSSDFIHFTDFRSRLYSLQHLLILFIFGLLTAGQEPSPSPVHC